MARCQEKANKPPRNAGEVIDDNNGTCEEQGVAEDEKDQGDERQDDSFREITESFLKLDPEEEVPSLNIENQASKELLKPVLKNAVVLIIVG